jgi:CubicO group peptidase (beta-lactamase class C family)
VTRRSLLVSALAASAAATLPALGETRKVSAQAAGTPVPGAGLDAITSDLDAFVAKRMAELQVPGVAVGIVAGNDEYAAGFGVTNLDHPNPVDTETLFQIGSTTKTVTGTALMRLVEEGKVDLESPVREYLPDFRVADASVSEEVLVRHLVTHSPGWSGDDFTDTGRGDDALARYVDEMSDLPQIAPLGDFFSYNNAGFSLLGRIIEVVTHQTYEDAVQELVLTPLGLEHSYFFPEQAMTQAFAVGHAPPPDDPEGAPQVVPDWAFPRAINPAGGITSSVTDQLRYARFHLGTGPAATDMLSAASITAMQTPHGPGGSLGLYQLDGVGVSWMLSTLGGERVVMHGGSTNGQQSAFLLLPDVGFGMTVLTNADAGAVLAEETLLWVLDRLYGLTLPERTPIKVSPDEAAAYAGNYASDTGVNLEVTEQDGELSLNVTVNGEPLPDGSGPLVMVEPDRAVFDFAGMPFLTDFVRDDTGAVSWIRFSGRLSPRAD